MTYHIFGTLLLCSSIFISPVLATAPQDVKTEVATPPQQVIKGSKLTQVKRSEPSPMILSLIQKEAQAFNLDASDLYDTISCESNFDPDVQSNHYANGKREESFGLSQINLPYNPDVTYEQAIDPAFAVHFMAYHFAQGHHSMWSCWKIVRPEQL